LRDEDGQNVRISTVFHDCCFFDQKKLEAMLKLILHTVVSLVWLLLTPVGTADAIRFAALGGSSPFFEPVEKGWNDTCRRLGVDCTYIVPDFSNVSFENQAIAICEAEVLKLLESGIDGLALGNDGCVDDTARWENLIKENTNPGLPIVLFDHDVINSTRTAYVGTDNVMMGRTMARLLKQLRPEGGTFVIVARVLERNAGFIEEITRDNNRDDRAHWHLIDDEDISTDLVGSAQYIDLMDQYAEKHSPSAFIIMRQTPMRSSNWTDHVDRHRHRGITYIGTDGSDYQLSYLDRKYVDGLIGQLPYEFGSASVQALYDVIVEKKEVEDIIATNLISYNLIPLELPNLDVDQNVLEGLKYIGWTSFGLIALSVLACLLWTFVFREGVIVRASQPFFLAMTAVGILIMGCTLIPLSYDDNGELGSMSGFKSVGVCMSIPWLAFTGFTITFSALFSKTWRINTLLNRSSHFVRATVEPRHVLGPFAALLACNWIVLICWTILDPLTYERQFLPGTDFWNREFASAGSCRSENAIAYLIPLGLRK
jgi:gamma-aminobutyric acid type B receptor